MQLVLAAITTTGESVTDFAWTAIVFCERDGIMLTFGVEDATAADVN